MSKDATGDASDGKQHARLHLAPLIDTGNEHSTRLLAGILGSVSDLFVALNADFRLVVFNEAFQREFTELFGQAPLLGQHFAEAMPPGSQSQALLDGVGRAFAGKTFSMIQELTGNRGQTKVYRLNLSPILNAEGQAVIIGVVGRDVTEMHEADARFRMLLEASPDAMLISRGGVIEYINAHAEEMFGYPHQALLGKPIETLVPRESRDQHARERAGYESAPKTRPMGIGMVLYGMRADGTRIPVEVSLSPYTAAGQTMVVAAIRDITVRRQAEQKLRARITELEDTATQLKVEMNDWRKRERSASNMSEHYRAVFESGAAGIAVTDTEARFLQVNRALCEMSGYAHDELLQLTIHDITHPDDVEADRALDAALLSGMRSSYALEKRFLRKDGSVMWGALSASIRRDAEKSSEILVYVVADITRRKESEKRLSSAHLRMKIATEVGRLAFWEYDVATRETYFSPEWKEQLGYVNEDLPSGIGEWENLLHPDDRARVFAEFEHFVAQPQGERQIEYRLQHRDGQYRWFMSRMIALESVAGQVRKIVGVRLDITDRKEIEQSIRRQAQYDPLTGLPNRALLHDYSEHIVAAAKRNRWHGALAFIDLDRFKEVNDTYGHEAGDEVLRRVASRLQASIRKGDIAGRLGGDEFLVILPQVADVANAEDIAGKILRRLNKPFAFGDAQLACSPSIGVALFPDDGEDVDTLIQKADHAMYAAKQSGRGRVKIYTPELARHANNVLAYESRLKAAFEHNEFELHFQPITDAKNAALVGAEALLRWKPKPRKIVMPTDFLSVAESIGLIEDLGAWAMRVACAQYAQWRQRGIPLSRMSINFSTVQFRRRNVIAEIEEIIRQCGIDPAHIQIEIAESAIAHELERAIEVLQELHEFGVRVAIDHFGTGGCGLGELIRLPIDTLKLHLSFVQQLRRKGRSESAVKTVIDMCHGLDLEVIAEGIESADALDQARELECDLVQGFGIGKPMRVQEFERWCVGRAGS